MNSSFLFFGQITLVLLGFLHTFALVAQFGFPRDTIRSLGMLFLFTLSLMLLTDALVWKNIYLVFYYPSAYGVFLGVMGTAWPAFVWLGVLDHPTQLHRKIMWRLPFIGALAGHALPMEVSLMVFAVGWITGSVLIFNNFNQQRYLGRILMAQIFVAIVYWIFLRTGILMGAQFALGIWIILVHRTINGILVKNKIREFAPTEKEVVA